MVKLRAKKPDDSISAGDFQTKIVNEVKVSHPGFDVNDFNWKSYNSDGKFTKDKISNMIEDMRNNITSKNNLNSQVQLKVKMTENVTATRRSNGKIRGMTISAECSKRSTNNRAENSRQQGTTDNSQTTANSLHQHMRGARSQMRLHMV